MSHRPSRNRAARKTISPNRIGHLKAGGVALIAFRSVRCDAVSFRRSGRSTIFRNVRNYCMTEPHPIRLVPAATSVWEPKIWLQISNFFFCNLDVRKSWQITGDGTASVQTQNCGIWNMHVRRRDEQVYRTTCDTLDSCCYGTPDASVSRQGLSFVRIFIHFHTSYYNCVSCELLWSVFVQVAVCRLSASVLNGSSVGRLAGEVREAPAAFVCGWKSQVLTLDRAQFLDSVDIEQAFGMAWNAGIITSYSTVLLMFIQSIVLRHVLTVIWMTWLSIA